MTYRTLENLLNDLSNKDRSHMFVRLLRDAVREGRVDAAHLPGRVEVPVNRRADGPGTRAVRNMIVEVTPAFDAWFAEVNAALAPRMRKPVVSQEAFESGELNFAEHARQTRELLAAKFERGQQLGRTVKPTRRAAGKGGKAAVSGKAASTKAGSAKSARGKSADARKR